MWTQFMDMHSGGGSKEKWEYIYIEAPESEARTIFYNRFGHNPERVTCTCCGEDYSITEYESLEQATAFERGCRYSDASGKWVEGPRHSNREYRTLDEYKKGDRVLFICDGEIAPDEREGDIPSQGYIWID